MSREGGLLIAPSTFYEHLAIARAPVRASDRAKRDELLRREVKRVWDQNVKVKVHGVRKVWRHMRREGFDTARCTVVRLMRQLGIQGVVRGKALFKSPSSSTASPTGSSAGGRHGRRKLRSCSMPRNRHFMSGDRLVI
jgi:hypothetical protein